MTTGRSGFEARTDAPERRAFFDLRRRLDALDGGGSGGGGAGDEIWVGPDTPPSPGHEMWYDTDAVADIPTAFPRGLIGSTVGPGADTALANSGWQDVAGLSVTFTPLAGPNRNFLMTFLGTIKVATAGGTQIVGIWNGSAHVALQEIYAPTSGTAIPFNVAVIATIAGGVVRTFKAQVYNNGGSAQIMGAGGRNARFIIQDLGSV